RVRRLGGRQARGAQLRHLHADFAHHFRARDDAAHGIAVVRPKVAAGVGERGANQRAAGLHQPIAPMTRGFFPATTALRAAFAASALPAFGALLPAAATAAPAPGGLVKLACPAKADVNHPCRAVYFFGNDGKRHAFPNARVYATWYADFSGV